MDVIADGDINITSLTETAQKLLSRVSQLEETREVSTADLRVAMDTMWVFSCGVEICTMQLGFAMLEAGFVREQNVVATYMKNIVDFLISIFAATLGSYNIAYPDESVFMPEVSTDLQHHILRKNYFFHVLFQGTAATIVSGAMAERVAIKGYLAFSILLSGFVFPMAVRLTWGGGYLRQLEEPFHDFAGSGVVHLLGGSAAFVGAVLLGSRTGRWDPNQASKWVPHDLSMVLSGMLILWCGWYGFNTGSSLQLNDLDSAGIVSTAFVSTTASAAAGGATIVLLSLLATRGHSIDVLHMVNGILGGLVSITAGCDVISGWHAMIIGMLASLLCMAFTTTIEKLHIDDVCDATGVHGACGLWGLLAVGLFHADKGLLITGNWDLLKSQAWGGLILFSLGAGSSLIFLAGLCLMRGLRIDAVEESMGLDAKLGFRAYVRSTEQARDFQDIITVLASCDHTPEQAIEALSSLKKACVLTLTPQAADNKLNGELEDIVGHMDVANLSNKLLQSFAFVLHHKKDGGEVVRVFTESFKSTLRKTLEADPIVKRFAEAKLIFFDDNDGHDLTVLLNHIEHTMNVVILLTRQVLKRPWCIAEITRAYRTGRKILLVQVEWPAKRADVRSFKMPQDLDEAIQDLTSFVSSDPKTSAAGGASPLGMSYKRSFAFMRSTGSDSTTHSPCKDSTTHSPCKAYTTSSQLEDDKVLPEQQSSGKELAAQVTDNSGDPAQQDADGGRVFLML